MVVVVVVVVDGSALRVVRSLLACGPKGDMKLEGRGRRREEE